MNEPLIVRVVEQVFHIHAHEPKDCPVLPTWPQTMKCCPIHDRHEGCSHDQDGGVA